MFLLTLITCNKLSIHSTVFIDKVYLTLLLGIHVVQDWYDKIAVILKGSGKKRVRFFKLLLVEGNLRKLVIFFYHSSVDCKDTKFRATKFAYSLLSKQTISTTNYIIKLYSLLYNHIFSQRFCGMQWCNLILSSFWEGAFQLKILEFYIYLIE